MATLNIPSSVNDPTYRYRMPRMITKIEGRGNGIKTVLVNMVDVARSLKRPPEWTTKFFGCELGAQTKFDAKDEKAIVNGAFESPQLQQMLDKFIEKFVLCSVCNLPETDLHINKKGIIMADCKACGAQKPADMAHKLSVFILKNPPGGAAAAAAAKKDKKDKAARQAARAAKQRESSKQEGDSGSGAESGAEEAPAGAAKPRRSATENGEAPAKAKKSSKKAAKSDSDEEEKTEEVAAKPKKPKKKKKPTADDLADDMATLTIGSSELNELTARLRTFLATPRSPADAFEEVRLLQLSQAFDHRVRAHVVLDALFDENILRQLAQPGRLEILKRFALGGDMQQCLLEGLEMFCVRTHPAALRGFPMLLKTLYDNDVLEEEQLLAWAARENSMSVEVGQQTRAAAKPFIDWLQTAEAEDDEDGEEEEDEEEQESEEEAAPTPAPAAAKPAANGTAAPKPAAAAAPAAEEEDLDIDAI